MNKKLFCADYRRISSISQKNNSSLELQGEYNKDLIESIGGVYVRKYEDIAISAYNRVASKRPAIQQLIDDVKNGKINCIVFYDESRLTRDITSFHEDVVKEFKNEDVVYYKSSTGQIWDPNSEEAKREYINAYNESYKKSGYTLNYHESKLKKKERPTGKWPLGIDGQNDSSLIVNQDIIIVLLIFHLASWGYSSREITRYLEELDIYPKHKEITKWNNTTIHNILNNETYIGVLTWSKRTSTQNSTPKPRDLVKTIRDDIDPVIPRYLWITAHDNINNKKNGKLMTKTSFLLSGLLICSACKSTIETKNSGKKGGKSTTKAGEPLIYYHCRKCGYRMDAKLLDSIICKRLNSELVANITKRLIEVQLQKMTMGLMQQLKETEKEIELLKFNEMALETVKLKEELSKEEHYRLSKRIANDKVQWKEKREEIISMQEQIKLVVENNVMEEILCRIKKDIEKFSTIEQRYIILSAVETINVKPSNKNKEGFVVEFLSFKNFPMPMFYLKMDNLLDL